MTHPFYVFCYILAAVFFLLAVLKVPLRFSAVAAGLLAWVLVPLLTLLGVG